MTDPHVVVDLGGVLVRFDHTRRLRRPAELFSPSAEEVDGLLWKPAFVTAWMPLRTSAASG